MKDRNDITCPDCPDCGEVAWTTLPCGCWESRNALALPPEEWDLTEPCVMCGSRYCYCSEERALKKQYGGNEPTMRDSDYRVI